MRAVRLALGAAGLAMIAVGVVASLRQSGHDLFRQVLFLGVVLVAHDALLMPLFLAAGYLVHRVLPAPVRAPVQAALLVTAAVVLVALPLVLGFGRRADNPSALPRDYGVGLAVVLAAVWVAAGAAAWRAWRLASRDRRRRAAVPG